VVPGTWVVLATLVVEAIAGYPAIVYARISHPVVWVGRGIDLLERCWNKQQYSNGSRKALGCLVVTLMTVATVSTGLAIQASVGRGIAGTILVVLVATTGLAQRSLYDHVRDVLRPLESGDVECARERVARIVGRDTVTLDRAGISAAALESLAESFNDGVVAPAFWLLVAGLPGLLTYKALNTADSLIGHKEPRWRAFGWAAARADDVANLVPARVAGILLVLAGGGGLGVMVRDAAKHASPNAGWPEAAMAGALGIRLGGPATYDGVRHERPVFGDGPAPSVTELSRGLRIYVRACGLLWIGVAGLAWPR